MATGLLGFRLHITGLFGWGLHYCGPRLHECAPSPRLVEMEGCAEAEGGKHGPLTVEDDGDEVEPPGRFHEVRFDRKDKKTDCMCGVL